MRNLYAITGIGYVLLAPLISLALLGIGMLLAANEDSSGIILAGLGVVFGLGLGFSSSVVLSARKTIINNHIDAIGARKAAVRARTVAVTLSTIGLIGMIASLIAPPLMESEPKISIWIIAIPAGIMSILASWTAYFAVAKRAPKTR
ncbi:hypothetical protein A8926_6573 [Saccharopolyspora spinosa]|uniref:Uncharacterized protein n=1 Tax=Saccharopolyspora spinosa TaxID=60894 RepID=A0A2N3Y6J2_SACSN|nr:hypothetical protein A8926_6573 [Saccharopolyspora spinosa]